MAATQRDLETERIAQQRNRASEFTKTNEELAGPAVGVLAITAIFVFVLMLFSIFGPTRTPEPRIATPGTDARILPDGPLPMPMPNSGPLPAPAPEQ